jgi:CheY-like chemotaxis protein
MVKARKSTSTATETVVGTPTRDVAAGTSQTLHHSGQRPLRLLLIEDHASLAEATAGWLRAMGMEVRIAGSGNEALPAAAVFRPEIVLCDMCLPDISGLEVARLLKAKQESANVFFVIHTAFGDTDVRKFEQAGPRAVDLCFSKPITKEKLDRLQREFAAHSRLTGKRERTA